MNSALLQQLVDEWSPKLGLASWDIRVSDAPPDDGSRANTDIWWSHSAAKIRVDANCPDDALVHVAIHEMLHIVLSPLELAWKSVTSSRLSSSEGQIIKDAYENAEEPIINQLTRTLAGIPTFDWANDDWSKTFPVVKAG